MQNSSNAFCLVVLSFVVDVAVDRLTPLREGLDTICPENSAADAAQHAFDASLIAVLSIAACAHSP